MYFYKKKNVNGNEKIKHKGHIKNESKKLLNLKHYENLNLK